jgi:hypothetical protein
MVQNERVIKGVTVRNEKTDLDNDLVNDEVSLMLSRGSLDCFDQRKPFHMGLAVTLARYGDPLPLPSLKL